jgi:hypothetical protein
MAEFPRRRTGRVAAALALSVAAFSVPLRAEADVAVPVDLIGTWHVLIHYTDDHTHNPDQMRWDDKIWVFESSGSRLRWTEYPIVVFQDQTGRFERLGGSHASRVLHGWEPNDGQRSQIASGLEVNPRGSKKKTLRKSGDDWRSNTRPTAASATIVSYVENWSVENVFGKPSFRREDILGSATTENLDGVTLFTTTEIASGGNVLRGTFERDGSRRGTFRLTRAGPVDGVKGSGKNQSERLRDAMLENYYRNEESSRREQGRKGEGSEQGSAAEEPSEYEPEAGASLPERGATPARILERLRAPPSANYRSVLRRLEVLRFRPDGFDEIPASEIESGAFVPSDGDHIAILALRYCKSTFSYGEHTSWYLFEADSLVAWDHFENGDKCVYWNHFEPAVEGRVVFEEQITARVRGNYPQHTQHRGTLYEKGLSLVRVGRVEAAERMLTEADENLDVEHQRFDSANEQLRSRINSPSDEGWSRTRLVEAIAAAKRGEDAPRK